ncbi:MAG: hypothetical protein ACXW6T_23405, partial [Candidatus Binatia bacterium]
AVKTTSATAKPIEKIRWRQNGREIIMRHHSPPEPTRQEGVAAPSCLQHFLGRYQRVRSLTIAILAVAARA